MPITGSTITGYFGLANATLASSGQTSVQSLIQFTNALPYDIQVSAVPQNVGSGSCSVKFRPFVQNVGGNTGLTVSVRNPAGPQTGAATNVVFQAEGSDGQYATRGLLSAALAVGATTFNVTDNASLATVAAGTNNFPGFIISVNSNGDNRDFGTVFQVEPVTVTAIAAPVSGNRTISILSPTTKAWPIGAVLICERFFNLIGTATAAQNYTTGNASAQIALTASQQARLMRVVPVAGFSATNPTIVNVSLSKTNTTIV